MYDLLLTGGTVIDPSQGLNARRDIAVQNGAIARIDPSIARSEASRVLDIPVGTVKWRISEARRKVRETLAGLGYVDAK